MDTFGPTPAAAGPPPRLSNSPDPTLIPTTTASRAGEYMKMLHKAETKATEAKSIEKLFSKLVENRVGTNEIENVARNMANLDSNKRGKLLEKNVVGNQSSVPELSKTEDNVMGERQSSENVEINGDSSDCDSDNVVDSSETVPKSDTRCTREPNLVVKVAMIKLGQAKKMSREARVKAWEAKAALKTVTTKNEYMNVLKKVAKMRTRVWNTAQDLHARKVAFLCEKYGHCCEKHRNQVGDSRRRSSNTFDDDDDDDKDEDNNKKMNKRRISSNNSNDDQLITGTAISDQELDDLFGPVTINNEGQTYNEKSVVTFGTADLDDDERSVLQRRPEFAVYEKVDTIKIQEEMNLALTKVRWDRRTTCWAEGDAEEQDLWTEEDKLEHQAQLERDELVDAQSRMIHNKEEGRIDLGARRATDMGHNQRLVLPHPRPPGEEAVLGARLTVWKNAVQEYKEENCARDGSINTHNLAARERIGLTKLTKRVRAGEIVVLEADKGSHFVVSGVDSYERQGDVHTTLDTKVTQQEAEVTQARLNDISRGLAKVFSIGSNWGDRNETRCWNNLTTESTVIPLLYPSPKTHKQVDELGDPKTRPIVQASSCLTSRPGEILADVLEAALRPGLHA